MNVTLTELRDVLHRIRHGTNVNEEAGGRPRGRALAALLYFGRLRATNTLGAWPVGNRWPIWRDPGMSRRAAFTGAIEELYSFPTDSLIRDRQGLSVQPTFLEPSVTMPAVVAIDPFAGYLMSGEMADSVILFWPARGTTRGRVVMHLGDGRWSWADPGAARQSPLEMREFNPANTIEAQQGFQCYYPVDGLARDAAVEALHRVRPECVHWAGQRGRGVCNASGPRPENCQGAEGKVNVYWPRALLTQIGRDAPWAMAPDGFTMIREYVRSADLDGLRRDLSILAGTCEALRCGESFSGGSVVIDPGWLGRQIDVDAWEALRA